MEYLPVYIQNKIALISLMLLPPLAHAELFHTTVNAECRSASRNAVVVLLQADKASESRKFRTTNVLIDVALIKLGNAYFQTNMKDDTDQHLGLANIIEKQGELKRAASIKRDILRERLRYCGVRLNPPPEAIWRCPLGNKTRGC